MRADKIRESYSLLKSERIDMEQCLDQILHINEPKDFEMVDRIQEVMHENEASIALNESESEPASKPKEICIDCQAKHCDIILLPCSDTVVCSQCWEKMRQKHETGCEIRYAKNQRKNN